MKTSLKIGDKVYFGSPGCEQTLGEVIEIKRTKAVIKQLEHRNQGSKRACIGHRWLIPFDLCTKQEIGRPAADPKKLLLPAAFRKGELVQFFATDNTWVIGTVARCNKKTVTVIPLGLTTTKWRVSPGILKSCE